MNDDQPTALREQVDREPDRPELDEKPREGEVSALALHHDPSLAKGGVEVPRKKRAGVEWVRPTDLMASRTARIAARGIDFQAELAHRSRHVPGQTYQATPTEMRTGARVVSERARKLPPVTAFGHGSGEHYSWVSRSGIGLG